VPDEDDDIIRFDAPDDTLSDDHDPVPDETHRQVTSTPASDATLDTPAADSPLERLRRAYVERTKTKRLFIEVPGWDGQLVCEFKLISDRDAKRLRSTARSGRDDANKTMADLLAEAHVGFGSYDENGQFVPVVDNGQRLGFKDVGQFTGLKVNTSRQGVLALFHEGGQFNPAAFMGFVNEVGRWMSDTSTVVTGAIDQTFSDDGSLIGEAVDPES
jgi:hypothetical protein